VGGGYVIALRAKFGILWGWVWDLGLCLFAGGVGFVGVCLCGVCFWFFACVLWIKLIVVVL